MVPLGCKTIPGCAYTKPQKGIINTQKGIINKWSDDAYTMRIFSRVKPTHAEVYTDTHLLWNTIVSEEHNIESTIHQEAKDTALNGVGTSSIIRQLRTDGIVVLDTRINTSESLDWQIYTAHDCIMMEFVLDGDLDAHEAHPASIIKKISGNHNLQYANHLNISYRLKKGSTFDSFYILLSKEFYLTMVGKTNKVHGEFVRHIREGKNMTLSERFLPMSYDMHRIINEVRNCTRKGNFQRICLEIKVLELILLQLEQVHYQFEKAKPRQMLHEDDIGKLRAARNILEESYNNPPTIKQLAQLVGVNELKLKKGFKEMYNSTIHSYVLKLRMERANQLVKKQRLQVQEVAMELGYKKPSHFSAAFKKHFGFLPSEMVG